MKRLLIGVSAPNIPLTQAIIATMLGALDLQHISMRQPLVNMLAALLEEDPANFDFKIPGTAHIPELSTTAEALESSLALCLRNKASNFFIKRAEAAINQANQGIIEKLYSGLMLTGIRTEQEAQWIRNQGGTVVHVLDYSVVPQAEFHALAEKDGDLVIMTNKAFPITESNVWAAIHQIRALPGNNSKAA